MRAHGDAIHPLLAAKERGCRGHAALVDALGPADSDLRGRRHTTRHDGLVGAGIDSRADRAAIDIFTRAARYHRVRGQSASPDGLAPAAQHRRRESHAVNLDTGVPAGPAGGDRPSDRPAGTDDEGAVAHRHAAHRPAGFDVQERTTELPADIAQHQAADSAEVRAAAGADLSPAEQPAAGGDDQGGRNHSGGKSQRSTAAHGQAVQTQEAPAGNGRSVEIGSLAHQVAGNGHALAAGHLTYVEDAPAFHGGPDDGAALKGQRSATLDGAVGHYAAYRDCLGATAAHNRAVRDAARLDELVRTAPRYCPRLDAEDVNLCGPSAPAGRDGRGGGRAGGDFQEAVDHR